MVNDLKHLMRENVADPPPEHLDLAGVVEAGRRRVRRRRSWAASGAAALLVAGAVTATAVLPTAPDRGAAPADRPPVADGTVLTLADATQAVEGRDYRVLASYTNEDLDSANGQYFDGVTDDGLILFRDGPSGQSNRIRLALKDPATGAEDWLPDPPTGGEQTWPVELGTDRLVLTTGDYGDGDGLSASLVAHVFDRATREWSTVEWPGLPRLEFPSAVPGPDGRLYVQVPATQGQTPEGGWPTDSSGEADDSDAEGDTFRLWSVGLDDPADVRDEGLTVGALAFTEDAMVWTDSTNGAAGRVHVRDLATGAEQDFDPQLGERCNLLGFGVSGDRIVMSQYCGTFAGGVRDDRVQVLTTDGTQVATIQDSSIDGLLSGGGGPGNAVVVSAYEGDRAGEYVYDLDTGRLLRVSDSVSSFGVGGPTPDGRFLWHAAVNHRKGATQYLGELLR